MKNKRFINFVLNEIQHEMKTNKNKTKKESKLPQHIWQKQCNICIESSYKTIDAYFISYIYKSIVGISMIFKKSIKRSTNQIDLIEDNIRSSENESREYFVTRCNWVNGKIWRTNKCATRVNRNMYNVNDISVVDSLYVEVKIKSNRVSQINIQIIHIHFKLLSLDHDHRNYQLILLQMKTISL